MSAINAKDIRCGVLWINDQEIFQDTDADLDRKAAAFKDIGYNTVSTFGCAHFRWSFYRYWAMLNDVLRRATAACHKYDIKVIEHHSAVLTHAPTDAAGRAWLERCLNIRKSTLKSWPDLIGGYDDDPVLIDDKKLTDFYYIDGRTGKPLNGGYHGYICCCGNPFYLRAYLKYLESVYATGVDGIMTDDVGYSYYACVCEFCRRNFTEKTGYEIPPSGAAFEKWHGNWEDPSFRAFIDFRRETVEDFHQTVKRHYEKLGLPMLRPNYEAKAFHQHRDAYCLQTLPAMDWVWQEAGGAHILDYSWPMWGIEAAQRFAVGRYRRIPAGLFTYPTRKNQLNLSWALAMSWGQIFTGTAEGHLFTDGEKELREFEVKQARFLRGVKKFSPLAFYDSRRNRELTFEYEKAKKDRFFGWAMALYMNNVPFDIIETEELLERLATYRVVVLREIRFLADWELDALKDFMEQGGAVIWVGDTGRRRLDWSERSAETVGRRLGIEAFAFPESDAGAGIYRMGKGELVTCGENHLNADYERDYLLSWWDAGSENKTIPFKRLAERDKATRQAIIRLLEEHAAEGFGFRVDNLPEGVLASAFLAESDDTVVIHLVNAAGILDKPEGAPIGHADKNAIPFPSFAGQAPFSITVRPPNGTFDPRQSYRATYRAPDREPAPLSMTLSADGEARVTVPAEWLGFYGLIAVEAE